MRRGQKEPNGDGPHKELANREDISAVTLPNVTQAVIEEEKVREYLLSDSHPVGRFKAVFFRSLGFDREAWEVLRDALLAHAKEHQPVPGEKDRYGQRFEVRGILSGPSDRRSVFRSGSYVWAKTSHDS